MHAEPRGDVLHPGRIRDLRDAKLFQRGDRRVEEEVDLVFQFCEKVLQHNIVDVSAEVSHGRVEQRELVLDALFLESRAGGRVHLRARAAVAAVDLVDVVHQLQRLVPADVLVERAAEVIRDVVFAVGERTRAAEPVHDRAGLAVDAGLYLFPVDRALALVQHMPRLEHGDLQAGIFFYQLIGGKDAARPRSDDDHVINHG